MDIVIWIFTLIATFLITEFTAWFNHKYIMHGPLWVLHKDHHKKDHDSWFERNDLFFFFYASGNGQGKIEPIFRKPPFFHIPAM